VAQEALLTFKGFGKFKSAQDLFAKLERDYARLLSGGPNVADSAYDFFVTGFHLLEWVYPDDPAKRKEILDNEYLIRLCSHIANGAKHFEAKSKRHQSVKSIKNQVFWNLGGASKEGGSYELGYVSEDLMIELDGEARQVLGPYTTAQNIAKHVLRFWRSIINPPA